MSRKSIARRFKRFGRKVKKFFHDHKKLLIGLGVAVGLSFVPGIGGMLSKGASAGFKAISGNPAMAAKIAVAGVATYGLVKGTKSLENSFQSHKTLLLGGAGLFTAYYLYNKIKK